MAYPDVEITNSTDFTMTGKIEYASMFCSDDSFQIPPHEKRSFPRGVCLITRITAIFHTPEGPKQAEPYQSSGTSYSKFAGIKMGDKFVVTRVVDSRDERPADYAAPTTQQK